MKKRPEDERKRQLDRKTNYLTLLPAMGEGFHSGYRDTAGIVSDGNQKPHEWLESVARSMLTPGEEVGYSIPDVLAGEQQLRRLLRLPHEEAMRHQELIDWRATLALLLLWDGWTRDAAWPTLGCENALEGGAGAFKQSVMSALPRERAREGLWLFTLTAERDNVPDKRPLCMLSRAVAIVPAADTGDLSTVLPEAVRWYDRARKRFLDPCGCLNESERERLIQRLRVLQVLNERPEANSPLYAADAPLCSLLDRYIADLLEQRLSWRERLDGGDETAARELYVRVACVFGLLGEPRLSAFAREERALPVAALRQNPLIAALTPEDAALPGAPGDLSQTLYTYRGKAFACASERYLLEPSRDADETATLERLAQELELPARFSAEWNRRLGERLATLADAFALRAGASRRVVALLRRFSKERLAWRDAGDRVVRLYYPIDNAPSTLGMLLGDVLGLSDAELIRGAFSDALLLIDGDAPFLTDELDSACAVEGMPGVFAAPPISPTLAAWLMNAAAEDDAACPRLEGLCFRREENAVAADFRISRLTDGVRGAVEFSRTYPLAEPLDAPVAGKAAALPLASLPHVTVWPNVRLTRNDWTAYFVHAHSPDTVEAWTLDGDDWSRGETREADGGKRRWTLARTSRYPLLVSLRRGTLTLGALVNSAAFTQRKRETAAIIGVDFGSIATAVALRQEDRIQPATLPAGLHGTLLRTTAEDVLTDELLPPDAMTDDRPAVFASVMDMFGDDESRWRAILRDGHIYYGRGLARLLQKSGGALYYDLKWGEDEYVLRCLRLFLKQTMVQAALSALLAGSRSLSWRVSMPNALPLHRQEAYLDLMRALAREVAAETNVPLTPELPAVLFASENQADGLYFRGRNEVNARGGYLNMDVGGGTTDISVWLNNAPRATLERSVLLGCRQMLFDSLSNRRRDAFEADFERAPEALRAVVHALAESFAAGMTTTRGRQKSMFLLDAFFAEYADDVRQAMADARADGRVSCLESVLLLNFAYLFRLCGELLDRCAREPATRALLPSRMEICVAGNGGRFLRDFDDATRAKLCKLTLGALSPEHPVREVLLVQSRDPKQEVAIGLLSDDQRMRSTVQGVDTWDEPGAPMTPAQRAELTRGFLTSFCASFPQAGERLLGPVLEPSDTPRAAKLSASAEIELSTILDNEADAEDDFAASIRCFAALKRTWRV